MKHPMPDQAYLIECLNYDPDTGVLTWKERPREHFRSTTAWKKFNICHAGHVAGTRVMIQGKPYKAVSLNNWQTLAHRVIWKIMFGYDPERVDHKDRDGANNKLENLRIATGSQNGANRSGRKNRALPKGVRWNGFSYTAHITLDGENMHLGSYRTIEDARASYMATAERLFGKFACAG